MKEKILVIDDEIEICNLLKDFLTREGFVVTIATSAKEGIALFQTIKPNVVLLDIKMPDMYGIKVMGKIMELDKSACVIMVTAVMDQKIAQEALNLGAADYIIKPFELYQLKNSLLAKLEALKQ
ncbi:CheY-like receiver, AAA-type ATPase, and DNA-binding domain containing response regulator [Candidatus Omnitrophus magneticus]|uniref:CheY-like receiver, AAA-type ATPase, and DNA-binding domain containing response regulator n=1 Tax=Candidatus Omnitrophus magneticus TaxID=1609969 RepID=A0A0F0CPA4_9BACT|nr:CheY-like receiver, AAA-type ATPase, and DNA-binding domain containing response regulator [Candidatus Omnitrophus magneticus]